MYLDTDEMGDLKPDLMEGDQSDVEPDLLPEYCRYRDEGCDLFDSCLNCPLPQCIYDQPRGRQQWQKRLRNREIYRLFIDEGKEVEELALIFDTSRRTIQRALKKCLSESFAGEGEGDAKDKTG